MTLTTRRAALTSLAGAALLLGSSARAAELKSLKVATINIIDIAPLQAAIKQGYFEAEGLKVEVSPITGGGAAIPGLMGGAFDICFGNEVSTFQAVGQNLPLRIIMPATNMVEGSMVPLMIGRKGESYKIGADFKGKSIGVNNRNNVNWLYARAWVKLHGGNPDEVNFKEIAYPQMIDALKRRNVDAVFIVEPFLTAAQKNPELAVVGSPFVDVQPGVDVGVYFATADYISKNEETIKKWARAMRRGIAWYNANLKNPEVYELISSYTKMPLETIKDFNLTPLPVTMSVDQGRKTAELMHAHGMTSSVVDASKVLSPLALNTD